MLLFGCLQRLLHIHPVICKLHVCATRVTVQTHTHTHTHTVPPILCPPPPLGAGPLWAHMLHFAARHPSPPPEWRGENTHPPRPQLLHPPVLFTQTNVVPPPVPPTHTHTPTNSVSVAEPKLKSFTALSCDCFGPPVHNEPGPPGAQWARGPRGQWRQIEGMRLNKPNYDMMTALTMVGPFQRSRAYSISPLQDRLSANKVIPSTVCIAEWNVRVCLYMYSHTHTQRETHTHTERDTHTHTQRHTHTWPGPKWKCIGPLTRLLCIMWLISHKYGL